MTHKGSGKTGWSAWGRGYGADLVSDSDEEQSAFSAIDGDLSDEFIETLRVEFLSDGTDACFAGLALLQSLIEFFLQVQHVLLGGGSGGD